MNRMTTAMSGMLVAAALSWMTVGQQTSPPDRSPEETKILEGKVVCLYTYLKKDGDEERDRDRDRDRERSGDRYSSSSDHDGPIALVVERDRMIGSTTEVHVILLDPESESSKENYRKARSKMGQTVRASAHQFERSGVSGLALIEVSEKERDGERREQRERRDRERSR